MIEIATDADLPRPEPDRLVLYVLGPGFGESQVIAFPDGRWMVVDGCVRAGLNLPLALLEHLGCRTVDLLVVTHPDLDHIRGVPQLIERFPPERVWLYPAARSLRNLIIRWAERVPAERRRKLAALRDLHLKVEELIKAETIVWEVNAWARSWPDEERPYRVDCLAPTQFDQNKLDELLASLFEIEGDQITVTEALQERLLGLRPPGDAPNLLSLALSVRWDRFRFLLAGDVENGTSGQKHGWPGVLYVLEQTKRLDLVSRLDLVKVAHHGSRGAFHAPAWDLHSQSGEAGPIALLTPFNKGGVQLPDAEGLSNLRVRVSHLGITADAGKSFVRARDAGFRDDRSAALSRRKVTGPILTAVFRSDGAITLHAGDMAALFQRTPPKTLMDHLEAMRDIGGPGCP
jgi:beta-lactamase superfamily II metal-dependent hydrolase